MEFPPFLDLKRRMSRKSLEEEFVNRYEIKLVLHTIYTLNHDFVDEDDFPESSGGGCVTCCAMAKSLALATKSELEIQAKSKTEDGCRLRRRWPPT